MIPWRVDTAAVGTRALRRSSPKREEEIEFLKGQQSSGQLSGDREEELMQRIEEEEAKRAALEEGLKEIAASAKQLATQAPDLADFLNKKIHEWKNLDSAALFLRH